MNEIKKIFRVISFSSLNFQNPEPWNQMWIQTRNTTEDGPMCPQLENLGKEDCLYLNVFVPYVSKKSKKLFF